MANFTELVFEEQVLISLLKEANAEISDAIQRKEKMLPDTTNYAEMEADITDFRENVIKPLRDKLVDLNKKKKDACELNSNYITYKWRH